MLKFSCHLLDAWLDVAILAVCQVAVHLAASTRGGQESHIKLLHHRAYSFFLFENYKVMPRDICLLCFAGSVLIC